MQALPVVPCPPPSHHTVPNALLPPTEGPGSGVELAQERTRAADLEVALQATRHAVCHPQIERGGRTLSSEEGRMRTVRDKRNVGFCVRILGFLISPTAALDCPAWEGAEGPWGPWGGKKTRGYPCGPESNAARVR